MWDGFNKRKFPRINVRCHLLIDSASSTSAINTKTQNLGSGGACVLLDRQLNRFERCRIRLFLGSKKEKIECGGKVVWIVPTREFKKRKPQYDTGIEFEGISEEQTETLKEFIQGKKS